MNIDLSSFFGGQVSKDAHPYDMHNEETWALPESMIGESVMLKNTFELIALSNNSFLLTTIMPLKLTNKVKSHWSSMEYIPALAASTPFLGVTRHVQSNRRTGSATMRRVGLGAYFEDGFLNGPDGERHFAMTLRQIAQGFLEGMQFDALAGLIESGNQEIQQLLKYRGGGSNNFRHVAETMIENELFRWGIFQQQLSPWPVLMDHIQNIVGLYNNNNLDTILADSSCSLFLRSLVFSKQAAPDFVAGNPQNRLTDGIENFYTDPQGRRVYLVRKLFSEGVVMSPMQRQTQIGEFFAAYNHAMSYPNCYHTGLRGVQYYSQSSDNWEHLSIGQMLDHCLRFDKDSGRLLSMADVRTYGQITPADTDFLHRKTGNNNLVPRIYFGDLEGYDLRLEDCVYQVDTCANELEKNQLKISYAAVENAFMVIAEALAVVGRVQYDANLEAWLRVIAGNNSRLSANASGNKFSNGALLHTSNEYGSLNIPSAAGVAKAWPIPPTHGDYGGFKTIQAMNDAGTYEATGFSVPWGKKIAEALAIFDQFADSIRLMYTPTPVSNRNFVHGFVQDPTHRHALFANIFHLRHPVNYLFLHRVSGTRPAAAAAAASSSGAAFRVVNPDFEAAQNRVRAALRVLDNATTAGEEQATIDAANAEVDAARDALDATPQFLDDDRVALAGAADRDPRTRRRGGGFTEPGARAELQAVELLDSPLISDIRSYVLNQYLGPLIASDDVLDAQTRIGAPIRRTPNGIVNYRFSTTIPSDAASPFARARWGANLRAGDVPFNAASPAGAEDILGARERVDTAAAYLAIVYDTLARWALAPVENTTQYAVQAYALAMLTCFKLPRRDANYNANATSIIAIYLDTLQKALGIRLDNSAVRDYNYVVVRNKFNEPRTINTIRDAFQQLRIQDPSLFKTNNTVETFDGIAAEVDAYIRQAEQEAARDSTRVSSAAGPTGTGYATHLNVDLSVYVPAPISLGRRAMQSYLTYAYEVDGIRRVIPSSFRQPSRFMSTAELEMARRLGREENNQDMRLEILRHVGSVFSVAEDEPFVSSSLDFVPCVANTRARVPTADEDAEIERQRRARVASERSSANTQMPTSISALLGNEESERSFAGTQASAFRPHVASTDASKYLLFDADDITPELRARVTEVLRNYADRYASQLIVLCFLTTQITRQACRAMEKFNLDIPFNFICHRPHQRHTTSTLIAMVAGSATCEMGFGNIMTTVGADATIQATTLTTRLFHAPSIYEPNNIFVVHNALVSEYLGGAGSGFIDPADYNPTENRYGATPNDSFIIMMTSRHEPIPEKAVHLSGRPLYTDRLGNSISVDPNTPPTTRSSYGTASYYNLIWGFKNIAWGQPSYGAISGLHVIIPNDLSFSSLARARDPITGHYVPISSQQGHWKDMLTHPGSRAAREGKAIANLNPMQHEQGQTLARG